jgi:hypothetical protein
MARYCSTAPEFGIRENNGLSRLQIELRCSQLFGDSMNGRHNRASWDGNEEFLRCAWQYVRCRCYALRVDQLSC